MTKNLPMTVLAHIDDVVVFQTAACLETDTDISSDLYQSQQSTAQANYGALNLGLHVNDHAVRVLGNRMRVLAAINEQLRPVDVLATDRAQGRYIKRLHWVDQVHGKHIYDVDACPLSMQPAAADAMVSQQAGLGLAIMTADCVPVVLYQPASGQIAAIHAGWQGLAGGVIPAAVQRFTQAGEIQAWIGVCISQANYEVDSRVRDKLLAGCRDSQALPAHTLSGTERFDQLYVATSAAHQTTDSAACKDKITLDLPKIAADQLSHAGVNLANKAPISCSYADSHYYSYRRQTHLQQPATGRMALIIVRGAVSHTGGEMS